MSLAENLLNSLDETAYQNMRIAGGVSEEHIKVGQDRVITVPNSLKTIAVKGDKDIETATIDCVRYWDGHDLSTFAIYLNYILPSGDEGTYIPQSITKSEDTFSFDWIIGSEFTYAQGKMTFWIVAKLTDDSGTLIKQWSSFQNSDCTIAQGGDKIYVPEKQTDQDVISQAISISRASAEIAEQQANLAQQAAGKAASDARDAAEAEVSRIIGELGVVQELGDSPNSVVSQLKVTEEFNKTNDEVNRNSKRITNIEQGLTPDSFETDDSVAYQKDVPANALPYAAVQKVGGMTRKCANLVNIRDWLRADYGTINTDGSLTFTAVGGANLVKEYTGAFPSGKYTVSNISGLTLFVQLAQGDYSNSVDVGASKSFTYDGTSYLRFVYINQEANTTVTYKVMLNAGTTAQPYEPYFEGLRSAKVTEVKSVGANLLETVNGTHTISKGSLSFDNGHFELKLNSTGAIEISSSLWMPYTTVSLQAGTYTVSLNNYKGSFAGLYIKDMTNKTSLVSGGNKTCKFTIDKNTDVAFGIYLYFQTGANETISGDIMLNKGSTALPYRPFTKNTLAIPEAVQVLDGYGDGVNKTVYNYIDLEKEQFVKRVGKVDMGTIEWVKHDTVFYASFYALTGNKKEGLSNMLCAIYPNSDTGFSAMAEKTITGSVEYKFVYVKDSAYTDAATFKAAMSGVMLVYELAEPIVTDISDLITADNMLSVEGNGSLTFVNEYGYAVPSTIEYQLEV